MSEISSEYANFENTQIDPQQGNPVYKNKVGMEKYDRFIDEAKQFVVKVNFGSIVVDSYRNKKKVNADTTPEVNAINSLNKTVGRMPSTYQNLTDAGKSLLTEIPKDFTGSNSAKIPEVTASIKSTLAELSSAGAKMPLVTKGVTDIVSTDPTLASSHTRFTNEDFADNNPNMPGVKYSGSKNDPIHTEPKNATSGSKVEEEFEFDFPDVDEEKPELQTQVESSTTDLENMGSMYKKQGKYDLSLDSYKKALETREKSGNTKTYGYVITLYNIAKIYNDNKRNPCEGSKWMEMGLKREEKLDIRKASKNRKYYQYMKRKCEDLEP
ncbi:MAG: tetratricopeptide repeat protein [Leptospiraceae bacterium]|nr:tetratricopeptide repeat protein [Leptospiraceae bacterium]